MTQGEEYEENIQKSWGGDSRLGSGLPVRIPLSLMLPRTGKL
jgi:hypothetical protein